MSALSAATLNWPPVVTPTKPGGALNPGPARAGVTPAVSPASGPVQAPPAAAAAARTAGNFGHVPVHADETAGVTPPLKLPGMTPPLKLEMPPAYDPRQPPAAPRLTLDPPTSRSDAPGAAGKPPPTPLERMLAHDPLIRQLPDKLRRPAIDALKDADEAAADGIIGALPVDPKLQAALKATVKGILRLAKGRPYKPTPTPPPERTPEWTGPPRIPGVPGPPGTVGFTWKF